MRFFQFLLVACGLWAPGLVWGQEGTGAAPSQPSASVEVGPVFAPTVAVLPGPFVHERQTVRVSERMAEIWVTLPEGDQSSVSVNHVEYPPEGEFRIFRTKLNSHEPQRFYLSAKRWDEKANRWVKLGQVPSTQPGVIEEVGYVTLVPGQRVEVQFDNPQLATTPPQAPALAPPPAPPCDLETALIKHVDPIKKRLGRIEKKLNSLNTATTPLNTAADQLVDSSNALLEHLDKLELAAAPHAQSAKVTNWFQFDSATQKFSGDFASDVNGQLTVNWPDQTAAVVIKVPNRISPMPPRPFTANVTFLIRQKKRKPVFNKTIAVTFNDLGDQVVATIPFQQSLASPLKDALLNEIKAAGTFRISATIQYDAALGELGSVQIDGPLGNEIDLTITP